MRSLAQHPDLVMGAVIADIAVILLVGAVLGRLVRHLRQPPVVGEIIAGIALGPSLLGLLPGNPSAFIFPAEARPYLSAVAQVGLLVFMFGIGWEFEKGLLTGRGRATGAVSVGSIALPFGLGIGLATLLYAHHAVVRGHHTSFAAFALFIGAAMSITAFPVLARMLTERGLLRTRAGALALASAAINDVLAWCLLALASAIVTAGGAPGDLAQIGVLSAIYVAIMTLVARPLLARLTRRLVHDRVPPLYVIVLIAGLFLSSYATTWIGIHGIFGAFAFGFIMPREPIGALAEGVRGPLRGISMVLLPVFFIVTGLNVNVSALSGGGLLDLGAVVLVACVGKIVGAAVPGRLTGMPWREAATLGLLMNTRGLTELIIINAGVGLGVLDAQLFTMMVLMALVTTALAAPFLPTGPASHDHPAEPPLALSGRARAA